MMSSSGRQPSLDTSSSPYAEGVAQTGINAPARFMRSLPPSAAAQAIFGNPSNFPPSNQYVERPTPERQDSQQDEAAFRYNVHSPETHSSAPIMDRNQSRSSSANERNAGVATRKRQTTSTGLNEPQSRTTSRHRSGLSIGGPGSGTPTGDDSASSSSRRGSGPGRKRGGKDKEVNSRGHSVTPSGLRDTGASTPDTVSGKMGDLRDPSADEEISTIFIVGFPDDITVCPVNLHRAPILRVL